MSKKSTLMAVVIALAVGATAAFAGSGGGLSLGPVSKHRMKTYKAYYDGHKDMFLVTDVSSKTQASAMHINYAPALKGVKHLPPQYFIKGPAAKGQLSVVGL